MTAAVSSAEEMIRHPPGTFLDASEIRDLTNKIRRSSQVAALRAMCVEHKVRPDGSLVVLRDHINKILDGSRLERKRQTSNGPNWAAI